MDNLQAIVVKTEEEARELLKQGDEAIVFRLLELSAIAIKLEEKYREQEKSPSTEESKTKKDDDPSIPSGMKPVYTKPTSKKRGKKRPGRKKGHKGVRRRIPEKDIKNVKHKLIECPNCGDTLSDTETFRERITEDIEQTKPVVKRHIIYQSYCKTCVKIVEPKVTDALPKSTIGLNLLALTAWFHYALGITISHILDVLNVHLHFELSAGGLTQMWKRLREILISWYETLVEEAKNSSYLHADETGWRVDGDNFWLWCFTNHLVTVYIIDRSRGSPALKKFFGELFEGVLITDFWKAYLKICETQQTCFVHLLRELCKVSKKNFSDDWLYFKQRLTRLLRDAIRLDNNEDITDEVKERRIGRLHARREQIIRLDLKDPDCKRLQKRLVTFKDTLFTFLYYDDVVSDNNRAEREIRLPVIMRKNSYQNKSEEGAITQAVFMTIYKTLKLRGYNPVSTVVEAVKKYIETGKIPPFPEAKTLDG